VNPVTAVDRPAVPRVEVQVLTPEQARQLLRALRGSPDELPLRVALLCGLRLSELLALRWGDVDLDRGCLVVRQALDLPAASLVGDGGTGGPGEGQDLNGPKTGALAPSSKIRAGEVEGVAELDQHVE
jgi:integrase